MLPIKTNALIFIIGEIVGVIIPLGVIKRNAQLISFSEIETHTGVHIDRFNNAIGIKVSRIQLCCIALRILAIAEINSPVSALGSIAVLPIKSRVFGVKLVKL